ncbi:hypothetical protein Pogu_2106 [Pyrobaculum oguniense TE7]|uniref:Uncharacterized protein n=1 Tax=Pyrobaculum oguniense (strain DSM 13380 / JCM 10595 / TE7) TaxID=698757 RepID=H6QCT7_PYROT|nr:hypothetical protein Pogu_2106 [Pyrobaculum oguniense TE7]
MECFSVRFGYEFGGRAAEQGGVLAIAISIHDVSSLANTP